MQKILLALLLFPILEIISLIIAGSHLGFATTVLCLVIGAALGLIMLKNKRLSTLLNLSSAVKSTDQISWYALLWPVRYLISGLLFISPGFFSDILALILLLPFKGPAITNVFTSTASHYGANTHSHDSVIEGEFSHVQDEPLVPPQIGTKDQ